MSGGRGTAPRSAKAPIEVERKFETQNLDQLRERVLSQGGRVVGEVQFTDTYFDTDDCVLSRCDQWLRRRDTEWELKVPIEGVAARSGGERTVFTELCGEQAICAELGRLHPDRFVGADLEAALTAAGCRSFANFSTTRSKFELGGCHIDADFATFGHSVVEIEVVVEDEKDVGRAEHEITHVAELLAAQPLIGKTGGKLETYIRRHAPQVLVHLVQAGILSAEPQ